MTDWTGWEIIGDIYNSNGHYEVLEKGNSRRIRLYDSNEIEREYCVTSEIKAE